MSTIDITIRAPVGDARDEAFERGSPSPFYPRPHVPSPNLAAIVDDLEPTGRLGKLLPLARKIEDGQATESEDEIAILYDNFGMLLDYIQDLADMCRRREEALSDCSIHIGGEGVGR